MVVYLILDRLDYLKSESRLESVVSRESSFLFNNLILLASCFAVLWGTLFPVISEAVTGEKISVDAPFFNRVNIPIGLFLLFLTGVGPLFAWRRTSLGEPEAQLPWPLLGAAGAHGRAVRGGRAARLCAHVLRPVPVRRLDHRWLSSTGARVPSAPRRARTCWRRPSS